MSHYKLTMLAITIAIFGSVIQSTFSWRPWQKYKSGNIYRIHQNEDPFTRQLRVRRHASQGDEHPRIQPRIAGGYPAGLEGIPSQAYILKDGKFRCGAVLAKHLGKVFYLTSGHCVWKGDPDPESSFLPAEIRIVGNDVNIATTSGREVVSDVDRIVIHESFDPRTDHNDIALVFPKAPVQESAGLSPIKLAEQNHDLPNFVTVSGWGSMITGGLFSEDLQKVVIPVLGFADCESYAAGFLFTSHQFCCGLSGNYFSAGPCQGDAGGPAIGYNDTRNEYYLAGIISYSSSYICGDPNGVTVLTKVANFVEWVAQHVK